MRARIQEGRTPVSKKPQIASPDQRDRAGAILHLQRTAGNAAVATMFTLQRDTPVPPAQSAFSPAGRELPGICPWWDGVSKAG